MARLILSMDGSVIAEYNMSKERYTIGRLPDNDVRIDNPAVSGYHSLIINILSDSFLEDLNSTNGTYVNGKLIKKHALQHGDVVTVGRHQLRYVDSAAEDADQDDEFARTMVIGSSDDLDPVGEEPDSAHHDNEPKDQQAHAVSQICDPTRLAVREQVDLDHRLAAFRIARPTRHSRTILSELRTVS